MRGSVTYSFSTLLIIKCGLKDRMTFPKMPVFWGVFSSTRRIMSHTF